MACYYFSSMYFSLFLITLLALLVIAIMAVCLWLSFRLFGLKTDNTSLIKVVGLEVVFFSMVTLVFCLTKGRPAALFSLVFLIGGVVLWAILLKRFVPNKYSLGRAIGSYAMSYTFASVVAVVVTILGMAFFAQVFKIDGDSMAPALNANQTALVYKFNKYPHKNEVIVYTNQETGKRVLGRVVGLPGDTVTIPAGTGGEAASVRKLDAAEYYVTTDNTSYHIPSRIIKRDSIVGIVGPKL